jgi:divalent metal cation (Fe/Co/Zn/Cd) transporter
MSRTRSPAMTSPRSHLTSRTLLCAHLALAVFAGLAANTWFGAWWLDGAVALGIAGWAVIEGRRAWRGQACPCAACA